MYDLVIENAMVYNPLDNKLEKEDVAVDGSVIKDCGKKINEEAKVRVNGENCILTRGIIDFHLHLFYRGSQLGVPPDIAMLPNGIVAGVDAGTAGTCNMELFEHSIVKDSIADIYSYINVCSAGLITDDCAENIDPKLFDKKAIKNMLMKYPDKIKGLKIKMGKESVKNFASKPLEKTIQLATELNVPVVVHVTDPGIPISDIASMLRKGDVFCHMYQGFGDTIIGKGNKIKESILEARKRGVIFDACNGNKNFCFNVAQKAIEQDFLPDIISTDLTMSSFYKGYAVSMPVIMSKYLALGLNINEILKCVTYAPARMLGMGENYRIKKGEKADLTLISIEKKKVSFMDCNKDTIEGNNLLVPQLTVKDGVIYFRSPNV